MHHHYLVKVYRGFAKEQAQDRQKNLDCNPASIAMYSCVT